MSIQLTGSALIIRGKTVVTSKGDVFADNLSANTIDIKSGGVKIKGDSNIDGCLTVKGNIRGIMHSITPTVILNNANDCLVQLAAKVGENSYISFNGVFITSDGWVVASSDQSMQLEEVWGTILNPTNGKNIDVLKAHHIFIDYLNGLCAIKFPDIEDHSYLKWASYKDLQIGQQCYSISSGVYPFSQSNIQEGTVFNTHFETNCGDYVVYDMKTQTQTIGSCVVNASCELIGILNVNLKNYGFVSSLNTIFTKHSIQFMISNLKDYEIKLRPSMGIIKSTNVTHIEVITSGLLGMFPPKGKMIDQLTDDSLLIQCEPPVLSGNIITHINNIELNGENSINGILLNKSIGENIKIRFITPPSTTLRSAQVTLTCEKQSVDTLKSDILQGIKPILITKYPYFKDFEQTNNKNARIIYEATHEKEIKHRKKMYLLDRLKTVKNRKKSKRRAVSRRKSRKSRKSKGR